MSTAATLVLKVVADTSNAAKGMESVSKSTSNFKSKIATASKVASVALLGIGVAAIKAGKAAAEDEASQGQLAVALTRNAHATKASIAATEDWISKQSMATGVADDELRPALGNLVRATGDVAKSQDALKVAMDVSAATGKDLGSVSKAIAKGYGGSTTALGKLVPGMDKATLAGGNMTDIMSELSDKTGGAMAKQAGTAAGQMDRMTVAMNETEEAMGAALLPLMGTFAKVAAKVATVVGKNAKAFQIIIGVIGSVAAAIVVLNFALKTYNTIQAITAILSEATWAATLGPILLVIAAVGLVVGAFVLLYKKNAAFKEAVDKMWAAVKAGAKVAAQIFKTVWSAAVAAVKGYVRAWIAYFRLVFGIIKDLVKLVVAIFKGDWRGALDVVKSIIGRFRDFFRSIFNLLPEPVQRLVEKIRNALGGAFTWLKDKMSGLGDVMSKPFESARDAVEWLIDKISSLIGWLGRIKFPSPPGWMSKIPGLGFLSASAATPSVAKSSGVSTFAAPGVAARGGGSRALSGAGVNITVTGALDPEAVARQIQRILAGHDRRVGLAS